MREILILNIKLVHGMMFINETLDRIILLTVHTGHLRDAILVLDIDPVLIQAVKIAHAILLHLDLLQDQELLDIPDTALALTQETKSIQYKLNHKTIPSKLKYICITPQKRLMV